MPDFELKANDRRPVFKVTIGFEVPTGALEAGWHEVKAADANGNGRLAIPNGYFTGATSVSFVMRKANSSNTSDDATYVVDAEVPTPKVNAAMTWVGDRENATLEYVWTGTDTNTPAPYLCEYEVIHSDGAPETFPKNRYDTVLIYADLDGAA